MLQDHPQRPQLYYWAAMMVMKQQQQQEGAWIAGSEGADCEGLGTQEQLLAMGLGRCTGCTTAWQRESERAQPRLLMATLVK